MQEAAAAAARDDGSERREERTAGRNDVLQLGRETRIADRVEHQLDRANVIARFPGGIARIRVMRERRGFGEVEIEARFALVTTGDTLPTMADRRW